MFSKSFIARYILQILVSVVFLASAWLKLYPIEPFELTLVDSGLVPWSIAPYAARLLLSVETFIGVGLLFNTRYTLVLLKSALYLTLFFSIYLLLLWHFRGNDINCGCFGAKLSLTPIESLVKNAVLIVLILIAIKLYSPIQRGFKWLYVIGLLGLCVAPFVLNPLEGYFSTPDNTEYPYDFKSEIIPDSILSKVPFDIEKGTYILPFLSVTCPHCKVAAQKLTVAKRKHELPRIHAFFIGGEKKMEKFRFESSSELDYTMYQEESFFKFNNGVLPTVLLVVDGEVIRRWSGSGFTYEEIGKIPDYVKDYGK